MENLYSTLAARLLAGQQAVLAVIVRQHGSTPRSPGAAMLLLEDGSFIGTVGGGSVELEARQVAQQTLENKRSFVQAFSLGGEMAQRQDYYTGEVHILFAALSGQSPLHREVLDALRRTLPASCWLLICLAKDGQADLALLNHQGVLAGKPGFLAGYDGSLAPLLLEKPVLHSGNSSLIISLPMARQGRVFVFGSGHVAQKLVPLLAELEFGCVLADDRAELANQQFFPQAQAILCQPYSEIFRQISITGRDYVAVMTASPTSDFLVLAEALHTPALYIGMLGSHKKAEGIRNRLMTEKGFCHQELGRIRTPIGLPIGGETPAEVALSIAAELVMIRAGKPALR